MTIKSLAMSKKKPKNRSRQSRKPRAKKSKARTINKRNQTVSKSIAFSKKLFGSILSLIAVGGFLFAVWPRISLSPGISLDLHKPFETPFIIRNDGYLPLCDVKYSLIAERMELMDGSTFTDSGANMGNVIEKLDPNKSSALFVNRIFSMPPNNVKNARIYILVTYKPYLVPFTFSERIRFKTKINVSREYIWYEYYDNK
ncbi:MAG: hypothetical protein K8S13_13080 [Desulfobacula sp.]|uniref:hypothetical protein n=1 Tax=Desulfobacula sp. TaxID=2593537 RepID=UPI0025C4D35A|nr:hypothetical protein [Desulfobacula sp.]MCD4720771.1 hypothetical protein [Desulfobacula sp.]